jgi:L-threonylcarbamoyladenylate synthase
MTAIILPLSAPDALSHALTRLQTGEPIAFPTDTVYGVGVSALDARGVRQLYTIKQRPLSLPIPVLLADAADMEQVASHIPPLATRLANQHWPGALTLVVPAAAHLPGELIAQGTSVALRVPDHDWLRMLIRQSGHPLAATSANLHGAADTTTATAVYAQLGTSLPLILDGGPAPGGIPSTVVDCTGDQPRVLRQGGVVV